MLKQYLSLADAVDASAKTTGFERNCASAIRKLVAEVEALQARVLELEGQEPVAWAVITPQGYMPVFSKDQAMKAADSFGGRVLPLYARPVPTHTAQSEPVELTDEFALTDVHLKAALICREGERVSVAMVQRKMCIGYNKAQQVCQELVDRGLVEGLPISPNLNARQELAATKGGAL